MLLEYVPMCPINNKKNAGSDNVLPLSKYKPLSEPMMA